MLLGYLLYFRGWSGARERTVADFLNFARRRRKVAYDPQKLTNHCDRARIN